MNKRKIFKRRPECRVAADLQRVSELYVRGSSQSQIGKLLHLSQPTVSRMVRSLLVAWRAEAILNVDELRALELRKLARIECTSWKRLDKLPAKSPQAAALLSRVLDCIEARIRLLGLGAVKESGDFVPPAAVESKVIFYLPSNGRDGPRATLRESDIPRNGSG